MAKQERTENATPAGTAGIGADQGDSVPAPKPSGLTAATAGAVGPGALAAAEASVNLSGTEVGSGLTPDDVEVVRRLAQRMGGIDALIRWLERHRDTAL